MKFRAARQNRIFQDVVDQIQEAILSNTLKPGDSLPPERELKEMFKTSRGTLREALRVLEQKGLIEIRVGAGGGSVVKDSPGDQFSEGLDLLIRSQKISLDHLAEFREGVEGSVAAIAAQEAKREDISLLEHILEDAHRHVSAGLTHWKNFLELDKKLHQSLARITGNPMYILIHEMVHDNIHRYYDQYLPADQGVLMKNYQDLCDIVNAVREGRSTEARILAQRHVRWFTDYMEDHIRTPAPER
ncbi:FadR family transcriptional regulator [Desulfonema ishimotonii]|uniref:FadR family transcriptional regulator n=1 Tax=Desulfonema ishimotonii TaxID=45657 RepID=A0A401G366_9BACT|nr:FadR/GntR family transcriptional regulator [Desulfonema ishimotonii]GBC63692.1 FadR family transcriptional regulator [Desulfonema ishimotonii]